MCRCAGCVARTGCYMPYARTHKRKFASRRMAAFPTSRSTIARGYARQSVRRMAGPPAALYARAGTPAMALKSVDALSTGAVQSTTTPQVLIVPLLGSAFFNRLSNRTRAVSLSLTGRIIPTKTNAAAFGSSYMRILIYYDRQSNGANPSQADVLTDTIAAGTAAAVIPESNLNINNRDRFMVLRDRKVLLPAVGALGVSPGGLEEVTCLNDIGKGGLAYQEFIKLKGLESLYNSTNGGTIGDISAGAFGILVFNADNSGSPAWAFTVQTRFKFLD